MPVTAIALLHMKKILIVGGGIAGWLAAGYLAREFSASSAKGCEITVIDTPIHGAIGVGEGTFPTIRRTLQRIGIHESALIRDCGASFKQGIRFVGWRGIERPDGGGDVYLHPFQFTREPTGLDLLSYWLLGQAGNVGWDDASSVQKPIVDQHLGPKLENHPEFEGPLDYAYHVDAVRLAELLRQAALSLGVKQVDDEVLGADVDPTGNLRSVLTRTHQSLSADLYVDCTGFRALLIGQTLDSPYRSCRSALFCDSALAIQVPYQQSLAPIQSCTVSTAQEAGWIWDIGLTERRGIGYVFSSAHTSVERADEVLQHYVGGLPRRSEPRLLRFDAGYREQSWIGNCVSIGLSAGFFEPLEATGIILIEAACALLARLFPWGGEHQVAARQFNRIMNARYERTLDFIKLHFCLSKRQDSDFWRDNTDAASIPDTLKERLEHWLYRVPAGLDFDLNIDLFSEHSWQHILYGMGYRTDLMPRAQSFRYRKEAAQIFVDMRRHAEMACKTLPDHRSLLRNIVQGASMNCR